MRSFIASVVFVGAVMVAPVVAGYGPAHSQDFSITNTAPGPGAEWIRKLQAWWDVHAYYPPEALAKKEDGTLRVHLDIHPDGEVWNVDKVQGSGSKSIDEAGYYVFHGAHLPPFPPGTTVARSDVNLALRYVLAHAASNAAFTIGTDPVKGTVVEAMMQRTCTGTLVPIWWVHWPNMWIQAIFYRKPDGTNWIKTYYNGKGPVVLPVTELGKSASWTTPFENYGKFSMNVHYWVWPVGEDHISGTTAEPFGTVEFNCKWEPTFSGFQADQGQ